MNAKDIRRIALSLEGAEEGSHFGAMDFRVGGKIFATLAHEKQGYGNLMLTPEQQAAFVEELPDVFLPVHGGWGKKWRNARPACRNQRRRAGRRLAHRLEAALKQECKSREEEQWQVAWWPETNNETKKLNTRISLSQEPDN